MSFQLRQRPQGHLTVPSAVAAAGAGAGATRSTSFQWISPPLRQQKQHETNIDELSMGIQPLISYNCLLIPVFAGLWWLWFRKKTSDAIQRLSIVQPRHHQQQQQEHQQQIFEEMMESSSSSFSTPYVRGQYHGTFQSTTSNNEAETETANDKRQARRTSFALPGKKDVDPFSSWEQVMNQNSRNPNARLVRWIKIRDSVIPPNELSSSSSMWFQQNRTQRSESQQGNILPPVGGITDLFQMTTPTTTTMAPDPDATAEDSSVGPMTRILGIKSILDSTVESSFPKSFSSSSSTTATTTFTSLVRGRLSRYHTMNDSGGAGASAGSDPGVHASPWQCLQEIDGAEDAVDLCSGV